MFIVTVMHNGKEWPLRGTTWAFNMSQVQKFNSREEAQQALNAAKELMKVSISKKMVIKEV